MGGLVAEGRDFQVIDDTLYFVLCLFFGNAQVQNTKGNFLINAGGEELVVRILEDDAYLLAEL